MLGVLFGIGKPQSTGLESFDYEKALRKVPQKQLVIETFKRLDEHVTTCTLSSLRLEKAVRYLFWVVISLALERIGELAHIHLPTIGLN